MIDDDSSECLICLDIIHVTNPVWECPQCWACMHLPCIQEFARRSMAPVNKRLKGIANDVWTCPHCRSYFPQENFPSKYTCFCGRRENPEFDPYIVPHTCGESCRKTRKKCPHSCSSLCHPGPCPPCTLLHEETCHCGRKKIMTRCGIPQQSCDGLCNKKCPLGHSCSSSCHPGTCPPCLVLVEKTCECGAEARVLPCSEEKWRCRKVCGAMLSCGNHYCEAICCNGEHAQCPNSGTRRCACGKVKYFDLPCDMPTPRCSTSCGERCLCGRTVRVSQSATSKPFRCEYKCERLRDCGKHKCRRKCCVGSNRTQPASSSSTSDRNDDDSDLICPPCREKCAQPLPCGHGVCQSMCHSGSCPPCSRIFHLSCTCGKTTRSVPCWQSHLPPPKCSQRCVRDLPCGHLAVTHKCHTGPCPPCASLCNKQLACGHQCESRCHSTTRISSSSNADSTIHSNGYQNCLPCTQLVERKCVGGHVSKLLSCSSQKFFSCGAQCMNSLDCGKCLCERSCHMLSLEDPSCGPCGNTCKEPRPVHCTHPCPSRSCHSGKCPPCAESVQFQCHCGKHQKSILCPQLLNVDIYNNSEPLGAVSRYSCDEVCDKLMDCSHKCLRTCHSYSCGHGDFRCNAEVVLRCRCKKKRKIVRCSDLRAENERLNRESVHPTGRYRLECDPSICMIEKEFKSTNANTPEAPEVAQERPAPKVSEVDPSTQASTKPKLTQPKTIIEKQQPTIQVAEKKSEASFFTSENFYLVAFLVAILPVLIATVAVILRKTNSVS